MNLTQLSATPRSVLSAITNLISYRQTQMEDVLEELEASAYRGAAFDEPASEDQVLDAQEQIFLSFPREYRDFLLQASHLVVGSLEPATVADTNSRNYLPEVCAEAWNRGLPRDLIAFCEYPQGYYCINHEGVILNWQDAQLTDEEWQSVWEWAREVWLNS